MDWCEVGMFSVTPHGKGAWLAGCRLVSCGKNKKNLDMKIRNLLYGIGIMALSSCAGEKTETWMWIKLGVL